jgi:hypothetical protein
LKIISTRMRLPIFQKWLCACFSYLLNDLPVCSKPLNVHLEIYLKNDLKNC